MTNLVLHFTPGASSQVTHIALEELDLDFERRAYAIWAGENRAQGYLAVNPSGKVPVLEIDGRPLRETLAILHWLDAVHPGRLLPDRGGDALAAAADRSLIAWFAATVAPVLTRFRVPPAIIADPALFGAVAGAAAPVLAGYFGEAAAMLGGREWLLDDFSVVDIYLAWLWSEALVGGFDADAFATIAAHAERARARPAARRALAREAEAMVGFIARGVAPPPHP